MNILQKVGAAAAVAAVMAFGATAPASAALINKPLGSTIVPSFNDTYKVDNTTDPGGTLTAGSSFSETAFFVDVDAPAAGLDAGDSMPVHYSFSVDLEEPTVADFGIANLAFDVFRNGSFLLTRTVTDAAGFLLAGGKTFNATWTDGDLIEFVASGDVLADGGGYSATISAVPLPAPFLMLFGALAGLGAVGWVRRARFGGAAA